MTGGRGTSDRARALGLYRRACEAGDGPSCRDAALLQRETPEAGALLQIGCDRGDAGSCRDLVIELRSARREPERSQSLFRRAEELYAKGCRGGRGQDCLDLGRLYTQVAPADDAKAEDFARQGVTLLQAACERNEGGACLELGVAYQEGTGVAADLERHRVLMERACGLGELRGCAELATAYLESDAPGDDLKAAALFERACRGGVLQQTPCREAGFRYVDGDGVPVDKVKGVQLLQAACAEGDAASCWMASGMLREGDGVPADEARAAVLVPAGVPQLKVESVKRVHQAPDPSAALMGVDPAEMPPMKAGAGRELIVVRLGVRRGSGGAALPVRHVWVVDRQGRRYPSVMKGELPLGQEERETRDMVFVVPVGLQPAQIRFELGALTLGLPSV